MIIEDTEILCNAATSRYTLHQKNTGKTLVTSFQASQDLRWLGVPMIVFKNRKEVEDHIKQCKTARLSGSTKDLGIPK